MYQCPHCQGPLEMGEAANTAWYQQSGGPVSLGCGTLILIAIIVSVFSGSDESDAIRDLERQVNRLETKIDQMQVQVASDAR